MLNNRNVFSIVVDKITSQTNLLRVDFKAPA